MLFFLGGRFVKLAIVGATGLVGRSFLEVLGEKNLPIEELKLLASERSEGMKLSFKGEELSVTALKEDSFEGIDIALFSAGAKISKIFAPLGAKAGCIVIDNSSCWRMDPEVPLVVPEVNPEDAFKSKGIIANPNCSTIQAVVALAPLHKTYGIKRVVYSTYQSVSGAGKQGLDDLERTQNGLEPLKFPYPIANNIIPQIDIFLPDGYTKEEEKMIEETRKIMHEPDLRITATCARVPVAASHSESINVEFYSPFDLVEVKALLASSPGVVVQDDPESLLYPLPALAKGHDEVYVGRLRRDPSVENGLNLWVVADNIRKGAASNAVQIAELLMKGAHL
ncbi:MAG: aspartate-semialdehyde dehydrogenase [Clostridiales bacterium]|jgi:aspartate-semialdehyde dehydrogenase|nr:aspartate-semialdehyde dehydrogenase [Clostridiales bacterium]MDR2750576.1 aspartate-semialdehyde dehydrogenase [Clostridiales bacterium]